MASWPSGLPQFVLQNGYAEGFQDTAIRSDMDTGPAKVRRRFTAAPVNYVYEISVTGAQLDIFQTFFQTTTAGGSLTFTMDNPRTGTNQTYRFRKTPEPVFAEGPDVFRIRMELEVLP